MGCVGQDLLLERSKGYHGAYGDVRARRADVPPAPIGDATDIAFAASSVEEGGVVRLYYPIADRKVVRATLRPVDPAGPWS